MRNFIDLHMHSTASDGTDSPVEIVEKVLKAGITCFALTDHDTVRGVRQIKNRIPDGLEWIPGIEFSSITDQGKCHILGYGIDTENEDLLSQIDLIFQKRKELSHRRIVFLEENYGIRLDPVKIRKVEEENGAILKPQLANLVVEEGWAKDRTEAIHRYLNHCPSKDARIPAEGVIKAIHSAGGKAIWAHPLGGEGETRLNETEFESQYRRLLGFDLDGIEVHYSRYAENEQQFLLNYALKDGLLYSGGSDYHGLNKDIPLGTLSSDGQVFSRNDFSILTVFPQK